MSCQRSLIIAGGESTTAPRTRASALATENAGCDASSRCDTPRASCPCMLRSQITFDRDDTMRACNYPTLMIGRFASRLEDRRRAELGDDLCVNTWVSY